MGFGIDGVRVGHWTDAAAETGCTLVELPPGTVASYEARGGAPATRELVALEPDKMVSAVDAVLLTGGSAFGLAAADGVMRHYERAGRGVLTPAGVVPIVPTLGLFDLAVGDAGVRPGPEAGAAAARDLRPDAVVSGRVGAGAGAYVGHWRGPDGRRPGGLGHAVRTGGGVTVAALVAVNAFGDVDPGDGSLDGDAVAAVSRLSVAFGPREHTTIGVVVTDAHLDKTQCRLVAQGAHDGLARAVTTPHTRADGDAFVAAATGTATGTAATAGAHVDLVRLLALHTVTAAVRSVG
ncbi:P1 family peptidase [Jatrophihabitans fulvus]